LAKSSSAPTQESPPPWRAAVVFVVGTLLVASCAATVLSTEAFAINFVSPTAWRTLVGAPVESVTTENVAFPFLTSLLATVAVSFVSLIGGAVLIQRQTGRPLLNSLMDWADAGWRWWCAAGLWEWAWVAAVTIGGEAGGVLLAGSLPMWIAVCLAGWLTTFFVIIQPAVSTVATPSRTRVVLSSMIAVYVAVFVTMNWRLWFNLYLPHGDSAMYEEHLWNLLHGKGFRSYLDQGLFLGEHIQFVHLGLIPVYVLWPSHLLLELCASTALACGAIPVFWMARRHAGSDRIALAAAAAYLLYAPMQFLDIEIDLKTFRPEAFGIPILLFTLDQLDRGRWRGFLLGVLACLTVKEDYAIILSPLGLWIAATAWRTPDVGWAVPTTSLEPAVGTAHPTTNSRTCWLVTGLGLTLFGVVYLWLATRVLMPWFRPGLEIHYTSYFSKLGDSPEAIIRTVLTRPGYVLGEVATFSTTFYALALLAPVGFVALLSPGRLAVGLPLFGVLCLNELARDPRHHFHAPLVAIVFWAVAGSFGHPRLQSRRWLGPWLWTSAFATGLFLALSPLSLTFWDSGSNWYCRKLYGPTNRGAAFAAIAPLIPPTARVASTDFVHPRFTHHARSYDYSDYRRKVSGYERRVPDDTDFIVIDTTHPYSRMHQPEDVPEFHDTDRWELVPNDSHGVFIVLRRRVANPPRGD
jgi:uncharacterized membrane protein